MGPFKSNIYNSHEGVVYFSYFKIWLLKQFFFKENIKAAKQTITEHKIQYALMKI